MPASVDAVNAAGADAAAGEQSDAHRGLLRARLAAAAPWVAGVVGALLALRPLLRAPGASVLDRVFWHDTLLNIDELRAFWLNLAEGPQGRGLLDWLYAGRFFHPQPRVLATSELMPLAGLAAWPFASSPVLAHNLLLGAALVLDCVAGAAFARALGARRAAALVGGVAFAFSSYTGFQAGRVQLLFLFPAAFALGAGVRFAREGRTRDAVATVLWTAAQPLLCLYYALHLALLLPVALLLARLGTRRRGWLADLARLGVPALVVAPPLAFVLAPYADRGGGLGLAHGLAALREQSGDPAMFLWADRASLWARPFWDVFAWDSAYFPGAVVLLGALAAAVLWVKRDPRARWPVPTLLALGAASLPLAGAWGFLAGLVLAAAWSVRLARRGISGLSVPVLLGLCAVGFLLFVGPELRVGGRPFGTTPYDLLFRHVPFFDGLRMVRRAGVFVNLALCGAAALALTRLAARSRGQVVLAAAGVLAMVEGTPLRIAARPVSLACDEPAYARVRQLGGRVAGDLAVSGDVNRSLRRWSADACGVATTAGHASFTPPLSHLVEDGLRALPDPAAHAWLWQEGVRHVVVRGGGPAAAHAEQQLAPIVQARHPAGADVVLELAPPPVRAAALPATLPGDSVPVSSVTCDRGEGCAHLADGDPRTGWSSGTELAPGHTVTALFEPVRVAGVEWHSHAAATDLPRGLRIERKTVEGLWVPWGEVPSISLSRLGRGLQRASVAVALPAEEARGVRLVQTGRATRYWWGGTELRVVTEGAPRPTD